MFIGLIFINGSKLKTEARFTAYFPAAFILFEFVLVVGLLFTIVVVICFAVPFHFLFFDAVVDFILA